MTNREVFEFLVDLAVNHDNTGPTAHESMKQFVLDAMVRGEWLDQFDRAVTGQEITSEDYRILRQALKKAFPDAHRQCEQIIVALEEYLSFPSHPIKYLIEDESSIVAANYHHVARIRNGTPVWITPRVAWDGIILNSIQDGIIEGKWSHWSDIWLPLKIALDDGRILEGDVIK